MSEMSTFVDICPSKCIGSVDMSPSVDTTKGRKRKKVHHRGPQPTRLKRVVAPERHEMRNLALLGRLWQSWLFRRPNAQAARFQVASTAIACDNAMQARTSAMSRRLPSLISPQAAFTWST